MCSDLDGSCNTGTPEDRTNTLPGLFMNHCFPVSVMDIVKILGSVKATTCTLDPFLFAKIT